MPPISSVGSQGDRPNRVLKGTIWSTSDLSRVGSCSISCIPFSICSASTTGAQLSLHYLPTTILSFHHSNLHGFCYQAKTLGTLFLYLAGLSKTPASGPISTFPSISLLPTTFDFSQIKLVARPYLDLVSFYSQVYSYDSLPGGSVHHIFPPKFSVRPKYFYPLRMD